MYIHTQILQVVITTREDERPRPTTRELVLCTQASRAYSTNLAGLVAAERQPAAELVNTLFHEAHVPRFGFFFDSRGGTKQT